MAKYKITGTPSLGKMAKGGDPGDKYYKNNGNQFKKNSAGQWFVYDPTYKSWNYVNQGIYNGVDLEANKSGFTADDASWATPKPKSKTSVSSYEEQRNKAVNNPLLSTEEKIKATSGPLASNVGVNANLIEQKAQEDWFKAQEEQRRLIEEAQRKEEEAFKQMSPEFYNSETIPTVARNSGALLTDSEKARAQEIQNSKNEQRAYIANDYVKTHRDVLINEGTNNAKSKFSNLSWDEAKELSSMGVPSSIDQGLPIFDLEAQIKQKFPNANAQQIKQYTDFIFQTREKSKEQAFKYSDNVDTKSALKSAGYYDHWSPDEIKAPGPGKHIELSGRMPQTAGEWGTRLLDIAANPLDAIHYGMSPSEEMPMNMYDYEKAKQMTGYEDGADKNLIMSGLDFASWMTGVGALGQGVKMLRPTGESVGDFIEDPNLGTAGNAALNLGLNALAFSGLRKLPGANTQSVIANPSSKYAAYARFPGSREVVYGNQFLQEAKTIIDLPGFKLAKGKVPASSVPAVPMNAFDYFAGLGASAGKGPMAMAALQEGKGLLPAISDSYVVTESPLTLGTQIPDFTKSPLTESASMKQLDTQVPMYRVEPDTGPFMASANYPEVNYGAVSDFQPAEIEAMLQNPTTKIYTDNNGVQNIGSFFPEHTVGRWWSNQPIGTKGSPQPVGTHFSDRPSVQLVTQVPFSKMNKYSVKNDPDALAYAPQPDKEFILPDEYRTSSTLYNPNTISPSALEEAGITAKPKGAYNVKGQEAKKQFLKDLQEDADYSVFKENAKIKDPATGAVHSSFGVPNVQNDFFKGQGLSEENQISNITQELSDVQKLSGTDDQTVSTIFNDIKNRKIDLWQTPEGQRRLQQMIDNTPSLEGQTPQSLVEKMVQLENINTTRLQHTNRIANIENELNQLDQQFVNNNISEDVYVARTMQLDDELQTLQQNVNLINQNTSAAFYNSKNNAIGINPERWKEGDIGKATAHELGHFLGSTDEGVGTTYLDDMLGGLKLIKDTSKQLTIPGLEGAEETIGAHNLFGHAKDDYLSTSLNYFKEGSKGTEKLPFVAEAKHDMLEKGIIQHEYDTITPKMIRDHYNDYKKTRGNKYPIRIYDIIEKDPDNFSLLAKTMNYMPYVTVGAVVVDQMTKDEDSDVLQAGLTPIAALTAVLSVFSKKPNFKLPKKAIKLGSRYLKDGFAAMTFKDKQYLKEWFKLDELVNQKNQIHWDINNPAQIELQQAVKRESDLFKKADKYMRNKRRRDYSFRTNEDYAVDKRAILTNERKEDVKGLSLSLEGVQQAVPSLYEGVTSTGVKEVTDFSTGQKVKAQVTLPSKRQEYKKADGKVVLEDLDVKDVQINPEYPTAIKNSINKVQTDIPGAVVFGSSVLVSEAGMPHLTGDLDLLITESNYNKNVKDKYQYVGPYGPAQQHNVYPEYGEEGVLDFNIIHEDANGFVEPKFNPNVPDKTPTEIELFRQFYPEQFQEAAKTALINNETIKINMKADEFLAGIDPKVKTIVDAYEASPYSKWGHYNSNKEKHVNKPDVLITYGVPSVVAKGQETFIKSVVGPKGNLGTQFTKEQLSDLEQNVNTLLAMNYPGDYLAIANDPDRMQLALNDFYINHTVFSREITIPYNIKPNQKDAFVKKALTEWVPGLGGSYHGIGLNTVGLGNPTHIAEHQNPIIGHRQIGIKLDNTDPLSYVKSVNKATSGNYAFTPEELKEVQDIFRKYIKDWDESINEIKTSRNILDIGTDSANIEKANEALKEFASKTNIRAIRKDNEYSGEYGYSVYASLLDGFDESVDAMMYALKDVNVTPKSFTQRKKALEQKKQNVVSNLPAKVIETIGDYDKISNLLNKGIQTADLRLKQLIEQRDNIEKYEASLKEKFLAPATARVKAAEAQVEILKKEIQDLINKRAELSEKIHKVKTNREKLLQYTVIGGFLGATALGVGYMINDSNERHRKNRDLLKQWKKTEKILFGERKIDVQYYYNLPEPARRYLQKKPDAKYWPTGEPIDIYDGYIYLPQTLYERGDTGWEWKADKSKKPSSSKKALEKIDSFEGYNQSVNKKYGGPANNTIEMELTPEEIKEYIRQGYVIEEIN